MTTILIKKKDTAGAPAAGDLTNAAGGAEIAVNTSTKRIYTKDSSGTVVEVGTNPTATTMNGNLTFSPDATYDIGASGATRPRNLFLAGDATIGGSIAATTLDLTNLEVTNIKAKDGTAGMQIADSTGVVSFTANPIMSGGTANGVAYLNGSKVLTSGSALTFDGTNFGVGGTAPYYLTVNAPDNNGALIKSGNDSHTGFLYFGDTASNTVGAVSYDHSNNSMRFQTNGSEQMRLTSTGLTVQQGAVFNESGADSDFRVESDNNTHALFVDAGNNCVGVLTSAPTAPLEVNSIGGLGGYTALKIKYGTTTAQSLSMGQVTAGNGGWFGTAQYRSTGLWQTEGTAANILGMSADGNMTFYANSGLTANTDFTPTARLTISTTEAVFNDPGNDYDFRVESDTNTHALFVDAGNNRIGLFDSAPDGRVHLITYDVNRGLFIDPTDVVSTNTYGASSVTNNLITLRAPYNGDPENVSNNGMLWGIRFTGNVQAAITEEGKSAGVYARSDESASAGYNRTVGLEFQTCGPDQAKSVTTRLTGFKTMLHYGAAVFNEDGLDYDFRVESDTNTHMLFVDAGNSRVGMGTATPATTLEVAGNTTLSGDGVLNFNTTGSAGSAMFRNQSAQVSVSTSATAITGTFGAGAYGAFMIVFGDNGGNTFIDTIIASNAGTPTVLSSTTVGGSPTARTYSTASNTVRLAMASGTYNVSAMIFRVV